MSLSTIDEKRKLHHDHKMLIIMTMIMHDDDEHSVGYLILPDIDSTTSAQS
jgi:hypothetical protein